MNDIRSSVYAQKVELLLRLIPIVMEEEVFAIHGGTAINLFLKDLPRYSVDIDLTYIPLADRQTSLDDINLHLKTIADKAKKAFKGMHVVPNFSTCKLLCEYRGKQVKIEVNQTKRGIVGGAVQSLPLSEKAQEEFSLFCEANVVPLTQLYGGKIAAELSRQHPRDLFDVKYMDIPLEEAKEGLLFCLLGSDRPIYESFAPTLIDQREAMENQFVGMTSTPFSYDEFEDIRSQLIKEVNGLMTDTDKKFLVSFEKAEPNWASFAYPNFEKYPSVQWKQLNLRKLKKSNLGKMIAEARKLEELFGL